MCYTIYTLNISSFPVSPLFTEGFVMQPNKARHSWTGTEGAISALTTSHGILCGDWDEVLEATHRVCNKDESDYEAVKIQPSIAAPAETTS